MSEPVDAAESNPHTEITTWAVQILSGSRIAKGIVQLVGLLRISLPILLELEALRLRFADESTLAHWLPKSATWWRFVFGTLRHALDFRIRRDLLLEISDAGISHSTYHPRLTSAREGSIDVGLLPIPNFHSVCHRIAKTSQPEVAAWGSGILLTCKASPPAIRDVVRSFVEDVHSLLK